MSGTRRDQRYFSTTRGQIVSLLRRSGQTVEELATTLDLTHNAVRSHLATLERDGLVEQRGVQRGRGKPALRYELTPEGDLLFPKAYAPVLAVLVDILEEQLGPAEAEQLLRTTGRRLAAGRIRPDADLATRLAAAVQVLNELGGLVELEERTGGYQFRGYSCPLGTAARDHPQLCRLAAALVAELVGGAVQECCDRGERPRCGFLVEVPSLLRRPASKDGAPLD